MTHTFPGQLMLLHRRLPGASLLREAEGDTRAVGSFPFPSFPVSFPTVPRISYMAQSVRLGA